MGLTTSKAQLLTDLQDEQAQWEALLGDIGEAHMTQPGVAGKWSIKDIVAHLTAWRRRTVGRFQAALRHEPTPPPPWPPELPTDDEINAWMHASDRDRPLADVLAESRDVFHFLKQSCSTPSASSGWEMSRGMARRSSAIFMRSMSQTCGPGWTRYGRKGNRGAKAGLCSLQRNSLGGWRRERG